MHVDAIHLQPLDLVQVAQFGLRRRHAPALLELFQYLDFQVLGLVGHETELGYHRHRVLGLVIVPQFG